MNPNYQPANSSNVNPSGGSSPNNAKVSQKPGRNQYNYSRNHQLTTRYGDVTPFEVIHSVTSDTVPFSSIHELRTYPTATPMMSTVRQIKTYTQVPMNAILPRTWEYIFTNPVRGDDVPTDALCISDKMDALIRKIWLRIKSVDNTSVADTVRCIFLLESILSYGSLTHYLGCSLTAAYFFTDSESGETELSFDHVFENALVPALKSTLLGLSLSVGSSTYEVIDDASSYRRAFEIIRDNPSSIVSTGSATVDAIKQAVANLTFTNTSSRSYKFNYDSLAAYQLSCAEYFSNQFVDGVYSAALYRDNLQSYYNTIYNTSASSQNPYFTYNGVRILYDAFSGKYFNTVVSTFLNWALTSSLVVSVYSYFSLIFAFKKSLRYTDYFTSAKTRPLAVGNVTAPVVSGAVSAIDMTRNIQMQRFLNSVNRAGRKFSNYVRDIFGGTVPPDMHEPHFLAQTSSYIGGFEVENTTSESQGTQVTLLKSNDNQYAFTCETDIPCIILGLVHYEVVRSYGDMISKFFFHSDRFEMFNPFMQYIGDQDIQKGEYSSAYLDNSQTPLGYQVRYCEYKQRPSLASGGFCFNLPSWGFVETQETNRLYRSKSANAVVDSDFIRSTNVEFDRFFSSLTYYGLAGYHHFILSMKNSSDPTRPIDHRPNIL